MKVCHNITKQKQNENKNSFTYFFFDLRHWMHDVRRDDLTDLFCPSEFDFSEGKNENEVY